MYYIGPGVTIYWTGLTSFLLKACCTDNFRATRRVVVMYPGRLLDPLGALPAEAQPT